MAGYHCGDARERGLNILLETDYGNPIYEGGGGWDLAGGFPTSPEALTAWDRWVEAMATATRVKFATGQCGTNPILTSNTSPTTSLHSTFAQHDYQTGHSRCADRRALAGEFQSQTAGQLPEGHRRKGKIDLFHWFIYHGYAFNPDSSYTNVEELKATLAKYSTTARMRQGENGCPSEMATKFALSKHPWTEYSQAKWDLRRMLGDLGHDVESAVFTICDFNHTGREINRKGLLRATADKKVEKIKLAYYSVQNVVAVFDDTLERVKQPAVAVTHDKSTSPSPIETRKPGKFC